jgi:transcriptional regulator with XRE-family HTH domain
MFKDSLKNARLAKGLTQADLSRKLYVSQQAVSLWETGKGYPDIPTLKSLAQCLGVSIDSLIGVEEFASAKTEKKIHPADTWVLALAVGLSLLFLLTQSLLLMGLYYGGLDFSFIAALVLLVLLIVILPCLYAVYKRQSLTLVKTGAIIFGILSSVFLGLSIACFISAGMTVATPWEWFSCFLVSAGGFGYYLFIYSQGKDKQKSSSVSAPDNEIDKPVRHPRSKAAWAGLIAAVLLLILFVVPWVYQHYGLPGKDSNGNDIIVYFSANYTLVGLLWKSGAFLFLDFVFPILDLSVLVMEAYRLGAKTTPGAFDRLHRVAILLMGLTFLAFFASVGCSFVSLPTY